MSFAFSSVADLFSVRRHLGPADWIYQNCRLRPELTERPGALKVPPYAKKVLSDFVDRSVKKISLCWGSQTSKTTTVYAGIAYAVVHIPKNILWVWPSEKVALNFAKNRWIPFINDCQPLRELCPISANGNIDEDKITNLNQRFSTCVVNHTGAGAESNVKSSPIGWLVLEEIDEISQDIRLSALDRVKGRSDYKIVQNSTPLEEDSGIWGEYLQGDQRKYHMPCPHCNSFIKFEWRQKDGDGKWKYSIQFADDCRLEDGTWDLPRVAETAHYVCPDCGGKIMDGHKPQMVEAGRWEPTNPHAEPGHHSYHLNSMYAAPVTFGWLMTEWLQKCHAESGLKKFTQGNLAEPWRADLAHSDDVEQKAIEADYERGELKGDYRFIAADTQVDHFRYVVRGFDRVKDESFLIDFGSVPSFEELDEKFDQYACTKGVVDCQGNRTQEVYEEVFKRRSRWYGSRGWDQMKTPYRCTLIDPFTGDNRGRAGKWKIKYFQIDKSIWEAEIHNRRIRKKSGFFTYKDTDQEYYDQLFAVYWVKEAVKGRIKWVRKLKRKFGDHYWDCECLLLSFSKYLGLARVDRTPPTPKKAAKPAKKAKHAKKKSKFWDS